MLQENILLRIADPPANANSIDYDRPQIESSPHGDVACGIARVAACGPDVDAGVRAGLG